MTNRKRNWKRISYASVGAFVFLIYHGCGDASQPIDQPLIRGGTGGVSGIEASGGSQAFAGAQITRGAQAGNSRQTAGVSGRATLTGGAGGSISIGGSGGALAPSSWDATS